MNLLEKLTKLANDLDKAGQYTEADDIDALILAIAAEEIDIDEAPMDLTEEEGPAKTVSPLDTPTPVKRLEDEKSDVYQQYLDALRENKLLKLKKMRSTPTGGIKVSNKGALSVYGLGKWPVTLYRGQWERLLDMKEKILQFIKENEALLAVKESK